MLSAGTRVGPYEIVSWLGAGGMGEVYRARDTKLHREVALKTLPDELARQPERLARLKQEARILASLNHPGIATLHGLEESDGVPVLVMELVEGETLSDRLRRGPLPPREALALAHEIALALEAAHQKGVLHRDLKPGNVRLTPDGRVKLLDFGLARAVREVVFDSQLDTETSPGSEPGAVLGTAPYMSPEQARGQEVDRRGDIWAFGCVVFEMLAGKRAFEGATFSDTVAAVLDREPDWHALPPATPSAVLRLLRRCLHKEKDRRLHDVADARLELEEALTGSSGGDENAGAQIAQRSRTRWMGRALWLVGAAAAGAGLLALGTARRLAKQPITRWAITLAPPESVAVWYASAVAISPDGRQLAYVSARAGRSQIYLRTVDRLEAKPIPGTEDGNGPFFSPDGRWLGFFAEREQRLKKVPLGGGAPLTVCDVAQVRGASWSPDGTIVFTRDGASALDRVSANGGTPQVLTTLDASRRETSHRLPEVLPGGRAVIFTVKADDTASFDEARIEAVSLEAGARSVLISGGTSARYAASGHLIYGRAGALWAAPFDPVRLKVTGPSMAVLDGVSVSGVYGNADFSISADGSLAYVPGTPWGANRRILRLDRSGNARPLTDARRAFSSLRLSPDRGRIALTIEGANNQVWVYDLERSTLAPQTLRGNNDGAIWTADGRRLTFTSDREGTSNLFWQPADGSGPAERLTTSAHWQTPLSWSPDGKALLFREEPKGSDVWILELDGDRKPRLFLQEPFNEWLAVVSPNGRWLAYVSDESGRPEVYVRPFAGSGSRWPISTDGGSDPVWARNGGELYYRNGDRMMASTIAVTSGGSFNPTKPRMLFEAKTLSISGGYEMCYDVTPDGEFLMIEPGESDSPPTQINVVLNWFEELRRLVPPK